MLLRTLLALQAISPGFETRSVLAVNVPVTSFGRTPEQIRSFYRELQQRLRSLPGVQHVAVGSTVPWRDVGNTGTNWAFSVEGRTRDNPQNDPRARIRSVSPGFFATLGLPLLAGRDFTDADRNGAERVVIINGSIARQLFPAQDPLNRRLFWTDPVMKFVGISTEPRRIVGVAPDIDDERIEPLQAMTVYHPFEQELTGGRLFVHAGADPYSLVPMITRTVSELTTDQPVERAATLADIRAEVLTPERLNTLMFGGFALLALAISVVGVAGVLAFSVSARTTEIGIRMSLGADGGRVQRMVLLEGGALVAIGLALGLAGSLTGTRLIRGLLFGVAPHDPVTLAGVVLMMALVGVGACWLPAIRAATIDPMVAIRSQ
jgi:predicted permease